MDDHANACRVAETVFATLLQSDLVTCFDTFMDVDRGYFPRSGFIDRRYETRPAARVYANLHAALRECCLERMAGSPRLVARAGDDLFALMLPDNEQNSVMLPGLPDGLAIEGREVCVIDLLTGIVTKTELAPSGGGGVRVQSEKPLPRWPYLLRFGGGARA